MRVINGTTTIASGASASSPVAISPVVNPANTILLFTYRGGNSNPSDSMIVSSLASDGSSISWSRSTVNGGTITIAYTLLESTAFSVQRFSGNFAGTSLPIALSPAIDTTKSFPILYSKTTGSSFGGDEVLQASLSSTTATLTCGSTADTQYDLQVVSSNLFNVQVKTFSLTANGNAAVPVALDAAIDSSKTFLLLSHISNSSATQRIGEKLLSARFTSAGSSVSQVTVERQIITAAISGYIYAVTLPDAASVAHSGLYTFSSSSTPTTPTNPWSVAGFPIAKTFPLICGSPNFNNTNNVTSDDVISACNTSATIADNGSGGSNISFQRSANNGTAQVYASAIYLPDSLDTATDTIAPSGIASTNQFGTATLTAGDVAIAPTGIASTNAFGVAAIASGPVTISPAGIPSTNQFGTATLAAGATTISPTGIASANQFGAATLSAGAATIAPTGIASTNAIGTPTISSSAGNIAPSGIANTNQFGVPTITAGAAAIAPIGIPSTNQFGTPTLSGVASISPAGIASTSQVGTPIISAGVAAIAPSGIPPSNSFGVPAILAGSVAIQPAGVASTSTVGAIIISAGAVAIAPSGITSTSVVGVPALIQFSPAIAPVGIPSANQFGIPIIVGESTHQPPIFRIFDGQERRVMVAVSDRRITVVVDK